MIGIWIRISLIIILSMKYSILIIIDNIWLNFSQGISIGFHGLFHWGSYGNSLKFQVSGWIWTWDEWIWIVRVIDMEWIIRILMIRVIWMIWMIWMRMDLLRMAIEKLWIVIFKKMIIRTLHEWIWKTHMVDGPWLSYHGSKSFLSYPQYNHINDYKENLIRMW